ncbi:hypothetical protein DK254_14725 [Pseudomonas sp. RW407]|nr:hypothetical protein DK254_14725 [Pseudomonas sp. RW407]
MRTVFLTLGPVLTVSPQALSLTLAARPAPKGEGTVSATANYGFSRVARCAITYREARIAPSPFRERAGGEGSPSVNANPFASKLAPTKSIFALEAQA